MGQPSPGPSILTASFELPAGVALAYTEHGSPSGVPVLLLHGMTDSMRSFERVLPHLPASMRAFALSQRGHGDSGRPAAGYRPRDFAADLAAFMDAFGLERAVIAGHSMGSIVAERFAIDYPERTLGLVLLGAFATTADHSTWTELGQMAAELEDPIDVGLVAEFQQSTLAQPVPREFFDVAVQESLKVPARVWRATIEGFRGADHWKQLGSIQAPTLIVWGDRDTYCLRAEQDVLAASIAGSQLVVYPGAGHALHWEEPERFAADLAAFTRGLV
jgi:non-heme chloroperoxidase